jgi:hypothetical protein
MFGGKDGSMFVASIELVDKPAEVEAHIIVVSDVLWMSVLEAGELELIVSGTNTPVLELSERIPFAEEIVCMAGMFIAITGASSGIPAKRTG